MGWRKSIVERTFGFPEFTGPEAIVSSYFISPILLILYRTICFAFAAFVLGAYFFVNKDDLGAGQMYFTVMSFEFVLIHFGLGLLMSVILKSWRLSRSYSEESSLHTEGKLIWFAKFVIVVAEVITCNAAVVVLVYWTLLRGGKRTPFEAFLNFSVHGINWPLIWIDMILNRIRFHAGHVVYVVILLLGYLFFSFVFHDQYDVWIYDFLDYSEGKRAAIFYIAVFVGFIIVYYVAFGLTRLRDHIGKRSTPESSKDIPLTSSPTIPPVSFSAEASNETV